MLIRGHRAKGGELRSLDITLLKVPPFVVTLGGLSIFRGLTLWLLGGQNVGPFPKSFQLLTTGFIPDVIGSGKPNITLRFCTACEAGEVAVENGDLGHKFFQN